MCRAKAVGKIKTHLMFIHYFSENRAVYEIKRKNMIQPVRPYVTILAGNIRTKENGANSPNHSFNGKAISNAYFECLIEALDIQHNLRIMLFILSSTTCPAVPYLFPLSHKRL
jgi:hypothetical protein